MSAHTDAIKKIKDLLRKYGNGKCFFRGTTTVHSNENEGGIRDGINSTLYRWIVRKNKEKKGGLNDKEHDVLKAIFSQNKYFSPGIVEKEIFEKAREMSQSKAGKREILTDIQHFGGKTNLIDFSRSIYVALFFACQSKFCEPGELIALHRNRRLHKKCKIEIINPANTQDSERRINSQKSVFVWPVDGYINRKLYKIEEIPARLKKPIMEYLWKKKKIESNTVYNDLHGFIKNEENNETYSLYFYIGLAYHKDGKNENAIEYYDKCIESKPNSPDTARAYNNRGDVYANEKDYERAFSDFRKAISLNPNFAETYYNQGSTYSELKKYRLAIKAYSKAIVRNPDLIFAYYNRGNANLFLAENKRAVTKKCKQAIDDYNEVISRDRNFFDAYHNRGLAKKKIGDTKGANADFAYAIKLENKLKKK